MELTPHKEAKAIILGSFVLYAINGLLDRSQQTNLTTIRLMQSIRSKTSNKKYNDYVQLSNKAWQMVVDKYKEDNYRLVIFDFVEQIVFEDEDIMKAMYGNNILDLAGRFSVRHTFDGVEKDILMETREIAKALKDATSKVIYDFFMEKKDG